MIDKHTKDRTRVQFARVLVEMEITDKPEQTFWFVNEYGQLVEQEIEYEWLPVKCKHCGGFGHIMAECRKLRRLQKRLQLMKLKLKLSQAIKLSLKEKKKRVRRPGS
uniref:CCHC-type domain-containing protein n=1 Tax=Cannabis sativa TaxID=3483 RepID=A0A803P4G5_CANSA